MTEELLTFERLFWRCGAIRTDEHGNRTLDTDRVPGVALMLYRQKGGAL